MAEHKDIQADGIHIPHAYKVNTYTELAGQAVTVFDIDKIGLVTDTGAYYRLKSASPIEWIQVSNTPTEVATLLSGKSDTSHMHDGAYEAKNSNIQEHIASISNPHGVTKSQIELGNVQNLAPVDMPISSATQTALNTKADASSVYTRSEIDSLSAQYYTEAEINGFMVDYSTTSQTATLLDGKADLNNGKILLTQLPDSVLGQVEYKGTWNASTNTPDLTTVLPSGKYYITSVTGTFNSVVYEVGDWILSNGTTWDKVDNTDAVSSVNSMTGNVVITKSTISLGNVDNTSDASKPISSATQTALNGKSDTGHVHGTFDNNTALSGANVYSNINITDGIVTGVATRALTYTDVGASGSSHTHNYAGSASVGGAANSVANSEIIKFDTGTTEGTDLYTFNGSATKTIDIKAGTNVTLTKASGSITINANDSSVAWTEVTGKPTTIAGYAMTDLSGASNSVPLMDGTGTVGTGITYARADHIHPTDTSRASTAVATTSANGLMASGDKSKLDGVAVGANNYVHPTTSGNLHIPSGGTTNQILRWSADGTVVWGTDTDTVYTHPTTDGNKHLPSGGASGQYVKWSSAGTGAWDTINMEDMPSSSYKSSCRVATTANITLSGTQTIDGIAVVAGDRVLVKEQTTASQNGIYVVNASTWTRALDADASSEIAVAIVNVDSGTANGGFTFKTRFKATDTLGTTSMNWFSFMSVDTVPIAGGFDTSTTTPTASNRLNFNGYLYPKYINLVGSADSTAAASHYFIETASDGFVRPKPLANVQAELVTFATVYNAKKTWFTSGVGTAGITGATNYALFPAAADTLTLGVGTYEIEMVAYMTVATSTVSGALKLNPRGGGTAGGTCYGVATGTITNGGTSTQTVFGSTSLGSALTVTATSAVAGRAYSSHLKGIMNITTAGTIIPAYQFSATLTSGVVTLNALNHMKIKQIASTSVTTAGGWV